MNHGPQLHGYPIDYDLLRQARHAKAARKTRNAGTRNASRWPRALWRRHGWRRHGSRAGRVARYC